MVKFNWETIGHDSIKFFFENLITKTERPHAYFLYGIDGVGKRTLAERFIKILFCHDYHNHTGKEVEAFPCDVCEHCRQKNHPDIISLKREYDEKNDDVLKKNISTEQVRVMLSDIHKGSFLGGYHCVIIDDAHLLHISAMHALLKTLEEPPRKTIFIIIAPSKDLLPKTISSRCQLIHFSLLPNEVLVKSLIKKGVNEEQARWYAQISGGRPGIAFSCIKTPILFEDFRKRYNFLIQLIDSPIAERFKLFEAELNSYKGSVAQMEYIVELTDIIKSFFRDLLLLHFSVEVITVLPLGVDGLKKYQIKYPITKIIDIIEKADNLRDRLIMNAQPQLAGENFLLDL